MTKPKRRSNKTPPATGQRQSARVKGRTPAPPDPQAWETVTTIAETAEQLTKVMTWYVQDIREGRHMKQEWILLHTNFIIEYRDSIHEQKIQKKVIESMIKHNFPYVHRGAWNTVQFWMKERHTYPLEPPQDTPNPTPPRTPTPTTDQDNVIQQHETPSAATNEMTAFENLLKENAKIIALTSTKTPPQTPPLTQVTNISPPRPAVRRYSYDIYEPGVEETKEEPQADDDKHTQETHDKISKEMTTASIFTRMQTKARS